MNRVFPAMLLALVLLGTLAGCGRKGDPEVPAGQSDTLHKYPTPPPDEAAPPPKKPPATP